MTKQWVITYYTGGRFTRYPLLPPNNNTHVFVVQKHFELVKVVPAVCFFRVHFVEIIASSRSERMEIEIRRQQ